MAPLGLPDGSIRGLVTIAFTATTCFLFGTHSPIPPELMVINTVVITSYFQKRANDAPSPEPLGKAFIPNDHTQA